MSGTRGSGPTGQLLCARRDGCPTSDRRLQVNPMEHRLFSEISRNWRASPDSYQKILNYARTTRTKPAPSHSLSRTPPLPRAVSSLHRTDRVTPVPQPLNASALDLHHQTSNVKLLQR